MLGKFLHSIRRFRAFVRMRAIGFRIRRIARQGEKKAMRNFLADLRKGMPFWVWWELSNYEKELDYCRGHGFTTWEEHTEARRNIREWREKYDDEDIRTNAIIGRRELSEKMRGMAKLAQQAKGQLEEGQDG